MIDAYLCDDVSAFVPGGGIDVVFADEGPQGRASLQDVIYSFSGSYTPGALEAFYKSAGDQTFDPGSCSCMADTGGAADLVWTMTVGGAPFATFTIHPDATGTVAFAGAPTIADGAVIRVTAPAQADAAFKSFSATLRSVQ